MNCVIPGANMKVLSKAILALSKIGDEVHLEAKHDYMILRTANMTTTAYCSFKFHDTFFSSYEVEEDEDSDALGCMLPMKALLGVFKTYGHKDMKPEICKIELEYAANEIIFKLKYKHDIVIQRTLYLIDGQIVNVTYNTNTSNQISATAQLFTQVLANFQAGDDDMGVEVALNKALMRNYIEGDLNKPKGIRSQLTLMAGEFNSFKIGQPTIVTYSLKPFKAAIQFAEIFNLSVILNFEESGRPLILIIRSPTFEATFVIATLSRDQASQSSLASSVKKKTKKSSGNITVQDQQALESINWDNDFDMQPKEAGKRKDQFSEIMNKGRGSTDNNIVDPIVRGEEPKLSDVEENKNEEDVIANSPEPSPRSKRIRHIFGRCYEDTFHTTMMNLGEVLAPNSDSD